MRALKMIGLFVMILAAPVAGCSDSDCEKAPGKVQQCLGPEYRVAPGCDDCLAACIVNATCDDLEQSVQAREVGETACNAYDLCVQKCDGTSRCQ